MEKKKKATCSVLNIDSVNEVTIKNNSLARFMYIINAVKIMMVQVYGEAGKHLINILIKQYYVK